MLCRSRKNVNCLHLANVGPPVTVPWPPDIAECALRLVFCRPDAGVAAGGIEVRGLVAIRPGATGCGSRFGDYSGSRGDNGHRSAGIRNVSYTWRGDPCIAAARLV